MPGRAAHHRRDGVDRRQARHDHAEDHVVLERVGDEVLRREDLELGAHGRQALRPRPRSRARWASRARGSGPCASARRATRPCGRRPSPASWRRCPATQPGVDRPRAHLQQLGGLGELGHALHLVEGRRPGRRPCRYTASPNTAVPRRDHVRELRVVDRAAVADRALGVGRVVAGGVDRLEHADRVDAVAQPGRHDAEQVGEPRVHARAEDRAAAALARVDDALATLAAARGR